MKDIACFLRYDRIALNSNYATFLSLVFMYIEVMSVVPLDLPLINM